MYIKVTQTMNGIAIKLLCYCLYTHNRPLYYYKFKSMVKKAKKENKAWSKCTVLLISPVSQVR